MAAVNVAKRSPAFLQLVLDHLRAVRGVRSRAMFGGHGIYCDDVFFGIVSNERLFLRTDDTTRPRYEELGMAPFRPTERQLLRRYFEVPVGVVESPRRLEEWARESIRAAVAARSGKRGTA